MFVMVQNRRFEDNDLVIFQNFMKNTGFEY